MSWETREKDSDVKRIWRSHWDGSGWLGGGGVFVGVYGTKRRVMAGGQDGDA